MGSKFCKSFLGMGLGKKGCLIESIYEFSSPNLTSQNCYKKKKHFLKSVVTLWCSGQFRSRSHPQTSSPGRSRTANCFRETRENQIGKNFVNSSSLQNKSRLKISYTPNFSWFCALQARSDTPVERAKNYKPWSAHWKKTKMVISKNGVNTEPSDKHRHLTIVA